MTTKMATALRKGGDAATVAAEAIGEALEQLGKPADLTICYCSPKYDYQQVVDTLRDKTNRAPLIGCSSAGDDLAFDKSYVFCDDDVLRDGVALCLWSSKSPLPISVKHGHKPLSDVLTVTRSEGSVLHEVDGRPAWEVWKEHTRGAAKKLGIDVDALSDTSDVGSFLIRYELGLLTGDEYKVRVPLALNDDGSLSFACSIFPDSKFRIMESFEKDQVESAGEAAQRAVDGPEAANRVGALVFDCVCRGIILGDKFHEGVDAIKAEIGDIPLIGFETYGEICRREGEFSGLHNTTTVVTIIPD